MRRNMRREVGIKGTDRGIKELIERVWNMMADQRRIKGCRDGDGRPLSTDHNDWNDDVAGMIEFGGAEGGAR